ncbi:MAG TPA: cytochrome b5 domain-containing protein [Polyangiaceae bacterium]|nr:cytochrome b5 domain-containing protein [Polyangiaceae bacterium]
MSGCAQFLAKLEANPSLEGHLSVRHGFLSPERPVEHLPSEYEVWDEMGRALPELFFSNRTQAIMAAMPVLSAREEGLPDQCLTRASMLLSALAHAYWRFGADTFYVERTTQVPTALPPSILSPWQEVSRRLGRVTPERPFQTFYDLFLQNYRLAPGVAEGSPALIQNIELMVPTFGNETERIFYGAFVEMHSHFAPVVGSLCALEDAVREDRPDDVAAELATIARCFQLATTVWAKIGPRPGAPFFCDPLVWAKTVAILGVPPALCPQGGTSGACAPIIYLMDTLLGRRRYETYYGQYVQNDASPMVPRSIHGFARCVYDIGLVDYVAARRATASGDVLSDAVRAVLDAYVGPLGWLGRHASKAFNYLCVSTITGRNASVSGHERYFSRQTWERAAQNLDASRGERFETEAKDPDIEPPPASSTWARPTPLAAAPPALPVSHDVAAQPPPSHSAAREPSAATTADASAARCPFHARAASEPRACPFSSGVSSSAPSPVASSQRALPTEPALREVTRSELSRHVDDGNLWIAIDGFVYDVSEYSKRHPGGPAILFAYAGRDVSGAFWQQNGHQSDIVRAMLAKFRVGRMVRVTDAESDPPSARGIHTYMLTLLRGRQAAYLQYAHTLGGDPRMKMLSDEHGHLQLWCDVLPSALEHLAPGLIKRLTSSKKARSVIERAQWLSTCCDLRDTSSPTLRCAMARRCASLRKNDLRLLDHLLDLARATVERMERGASPDALLEPLVLAVSLGIARYFDLMAQECDVLVRAVVESIPGRLLRLDLERLSAAG